MASALDEDSVDDILYLARANEVPDLLSLLESLSTSTNRAQLDLVAAARDSYTGNTALHYAAANGHADVLLSLLALDEAGLGEKSTKQKGTSSVELVVQPNDAGNTPMHYAALNGRLPLCKLLLLAQLPGFEAVAFQTSETGLARGQARDLDEALRDGLANLKDPTLTARLLEALQRKNKAGRDAAGEAEAAEKDDVVGWLLSVMDKLEGGEEGDVGNDGSAATSTTATADPDGNDDMSNDNTLTEQSDEADDVATGVDKIKVDD